MAAAPTVSPVRVDSQPEIRLLRAADVPVLRVGGERRLSEAAIRELVTGYPGRSVWSPETLEYAVLAPWRHREEIAVVQELVAVRHAQALMAAAIARCDEAGAALVLLIELDSAGFSRRSGLRPLEEVVTYELTRPLPPRLPAGSLTFEPAFPSDPATLAELLRIDHAAFPWLWWNSAPEFLAYGQTPGVEVFLGLAAGRPVAYVGLTTFPGWGHLDRIAVEPGAQGVGFGREALAFAVDALARHGARRIALSTQRANVRSQRLYERFGFRRSPGYDYRLYGAVLRPPAPGLTVVEESSRRGVEE